LKRAVFFPIAVAALVFSAIVGAVIFKVMADQTSQRALEMESVNGNQAGCDRRQL
jgi:hypothetical protein